MSQPNDNGASAVLAPIVDVETGEITAEMTPQQKAVVVLGMIEQLAGLIDQSNDIASTIALVDRAEAIQYLTKKINLEDGIKRRATLNVIMGRRRLGELTRDMPKAQGQRTDLGTFPLGTGKLAILEDDLELTSQEVSINELLARLPDDKLNEFVDEKLHEGFEITIGGLVEYTRNVLKIKRKPKKTRKGDENESKTYDRCQTPPYAVAPLLPYLIDMGVIWECASGEGLLVQALIEGGVEGVVESDILTGTNFFKTEPDGDWSCIVTNPPYSIKYKWLERAYQFAKPFALLMPVEVLGASTAQALFRLHGIQVMFLDARVNFKMPELGWDGSGAQFPVAWFTWKLDLPSDMVFAHIEPVKMGTEVVT